MGLPSGQDLSQQTWTQVISDKWQGGFQKQAIAMGCGESHSWKAKRKKPTHKQCLWTY